MNEKQESAAVGSKSSKSEACRQKCWKDRFPAALCVVLIALFLLLILGPLKTRFPLAVKGVCHCHALADPARPDYYPVPKQKKSKIESRRIADLRIRMRLIAPKY
ncbi:MAG: hypothetical protein K2X27_26810 [Candidatus Obscuribacterales bacterium]|nr:hypothetical protein [Candidatus Obscuribacterales bacterium]